ncbi:hypothetical protein HHI36_020375 [Cryptolaemus montrouzieri]|uniref:Reverse transcriptase domain-containing protein n=1 Tax=Cryptolaemus montrouzieri TaxID=559131 RepID=A0ABD2NAP8_9CUCU
MGLPIAEDFFCTLLFADDQVVIGGDSTRKTEYMTVCSDDKSDLEIGSGQTIKHSDSFKYLGYTCGKWEKFKRRLQQDSSRKEGDSSIKYNAVEQKSNKKN